MRQQIGKTGEDLACEYLVKKGHKIIKRNWRCKLGEIDIVSQNRGVLVFVEVKALQAGALGGNELAPEDNMSKNKINKLKRACEIFLATNPDLIDEKHGWRIDVVAMVLDGARPPIIRHYENI